MYIVPSVILAVAIGMGSGLLLRIFVLLAIVGLAGFFWTWLGLQGTKAQSSDVPEYAHAGDSFKEEITLTNASSLPKVLLRVQEDSDLPGYKNVALLNLHGKSSQVWQNDVRCRRRGRYQLGSVNVTAGDPFGLFTKTREFGTPHHITVYPQVAELPFFRSSLSSLIDFGHGASGRRISQISPSASSIREMMSGDSQEHIHWRSTAHAGKLMVKVFDAEHSSDTSKDVWIVLDSSRDAHLAEGDEYTIDYCVNAAASLARRYMDDGMRVGLVAHGDRVYSFSPDIGNPHFLKMLESLALLKAEGNRPIEELISNPDNFSISSTVVVITPQSTESVVDALRHLKSYGNSVVGVFVDSSSFGGFLNPEHAASALGALGEPVYVVQKGDNLAKALDSRTALWYSRYL